MGYQGIIFDLDGVICSTDEYHYHAWKEIARELNVPFNESINERMRGLDRMASLDVLLENSIEPVSPEMKRRYADQKNMIYRNLLNDLSPRSLSREVKETLAGVRGAGLRMAIGSSSKNTQYILEQLGLSQSFNAVVDGNDVAKAKPDPEIFLKAAASMGLKPKECLVVEDAAAGIQAARAGGMDAAGIGPAAKSELATYRLDKLTDLLEIM
jgi:beta-phosphoglucomutase